MESRMMTLLCVAFLPTFHTLGILSSPSIANSSGLVSHDFTVPGVPPSPPLVTKSVATLAAAAYPQLLRPMKENKRRRLPAVTFADPGNLIEIVTIDVDTGRVLSIVAGVANDAGVSSAVLFSVGGIAVFAVAGLVLAMYEAVTGGAVWPWHWWMNTQTIDFHEGPDLKPWTIWTEEGSGRVYMYSYATSDAAWKDMDAWNCARILMKWNRNTVMPDFIQEWGLEFSYNTIKTVAQGAFQDQWKTNLNKALAEQALDGQSVVVDKNALIEHLQAAQCESGGCQLKPKGE